MDLSRIPEPLRSRLAEQLDLLPPEMRSRLETQLARLPLDQVEGVLAKTAPLMQRLAVKQGGKSAVAKAVTAKARTAASVGRTGGNTGEAPRQMVFDPHDHYNQTIQRGDRDSPPLFVIMFVVACAAVFAQVQGWL